MIICPDCCVDIHILGKSCLNLLADCIHIEEDDMLMAFDTTHYNWKLRRNGDVKPSYVLEYSLRLLEKNGYLISTEISQRLIGVKVNREGAVVYDGWICWCGMDL